MNSPVSPGIVLIAEDDPDLGEFLQVALQRRCGQPVKLAVNGLAALRVVSDELVDVLVTDIQMPGMTGLELVHEIRKTQPALPIIMMTAHGTLEYAVEAGRHQVDEFLVKPVRAAELVAKVKTLAVRGAAARQTASALAAIDTAVTPTADVTRLEREMLLDLSNVMGQQNSLSQQLERAAQVQQDLLPRSSPSLAGYDFAGCCVPSFAVGGDFYDWYVADDTVGFTVADVMGKGIPAAIVTATVRAVIRGVDHTAGPGASMRSAATALLHDLEDTATFVTVLHGSLFAPTGVISYADAGHGLSLHIHPAGDFDQLTSNDLPLGVLPESTWSEESITLKPGETLISFSDGLFDLLGGSRDVFNDVAAIVANSTSSAEIIDWVRTLTADQVLIDDVTVIVLRRLATTPSVAVQ